MVKLFETDCEWDLGPFAPPGLGPIYRGHAGLRDLMQELTGAFEGFAPRIIELRLWGEQLLIRADASGKSELMGIETTSAPFGQVVAFRNRRGLRVTHTSDPPPYWDEAQPVE
jgi:hypothetical protein